MIGTHNGVFHADDVFSVAVLKGITEYCDLELVRTRDPETLETCKIVLDVGGVLDPDANRFDHHQRGYDATRENGIPYASFGQIWVYYGHKWLDANYPMIGDADEVNLVWDRVDRFLVQGIDAGDNGFDLAEDWKGDTRPLTVSSLVSMTNPGWLEDQTEESSMERFMEAVQIASMILHRVADLATQWVDARSEVSDAVKASKDGVVILDRPVPWQEHLLSMDSDKSASALYVVFPNSSGNPTYMIQCVPEEIGSFRTRKPLPLRWAGLRDSELAAITGAPAAVFVHKGRFIGGANTLEDAVEMARIAAAPLESGRCEKCE